MCASSAQCMNSTIVWSLLLLNSWSHILSNCTLQYTSSYSLRRVGGVLVTDGLPVSGWPVFSVWGCIECNGAYNTDTFVELGFCVKWPLF